MQTNQLGSTVRIGNHALSAQEVAAGAPERTGYVDDAGAPIDPDAVVLELTDPNQTVYLFRYPTPLPTDDGLLQHPETGRFYVDRTPLEGQDGIWAWRQVGTRTGGNSEGDKDVFYVQR